MGTTWPLWVGGVAAVQQVHEVAPAAVLDRDRCAAAQSIVLLHSWLCSGTMLAADGCVGWLWSVWKGADWCVLMILAQAQCVASTILMHCRPSGCHQVVSVLTTTLTSTPGLLHSCHVDRGIFCCRMISAAAWRLPLYSLVLLTGPCCCTLPWWWTQTFAGGWEHPSNVTPV